MCMFSLNVYLTMEGIARVNTKMYCYERAMIYDYDYNVYLDCLGSL